MVLSVSWRPGIAENHNKGLTAKLALNASPFMRQILGSTCRHVSSSPSTEEYWDIGTRHQHLLDNGQAHRSPKCLKNLAIFGHDHDIFEVCRCTLIFLFERRRGHRLV